MREIITIAMAIYRPNMTWLDEQLRSLNNQTFSGIRLLVWNDCPEDTADYESVFSQRITSFPFEIRSGEKNMGSTQVFAALTELAQTEYIAYCDQDDVWLPDKLDVLMKHMTAAQADMACSDMYVIDGEGKLLADSYAESHPSVQYVEGSGQFEHLLRSNFVTGCTILMKTELAKRALPFPSCMCHDHWLAIHAAAEGQICIVRQPLIRYRTHGGNQTGFYNDVQSREAYYQNRILHRIHVLETFRSRFPDRIPEEKIEKELRFCQARKRFFEHRTPAAAFSLLGWVGYDAKTTIKTFGMAFSPEGVLPKMAKRIFGR